MNTIVKIIAHPVQQPVDNGNLESVVTATNTGPDPFNPSGIINNLKGAAKAAVDAYNKAEKWASDHSITTNVVTTLVVTKLWPALVNAFKQYGPEIGNAIESGVDAGEKLPPPVAHPVGSESALSPVQQTANDIIAMAGPFAQMLPSILADAQTAASYDTGSLVDVTG